MVAYVDALHRDKSTALANSFSSMAAAIAAGTLSKPQDILSQTRFSNNEALGASVDAWKKWGECLSDALSLLHETGKLKTPEDYRVAWEEIAAGLRGAK
jgi:hypothetical protein